MGKRVVILHSIMLLVCMGLIIRLAELSVGSDAIQASSAQSTYTVNIAQERGYIYDRNLKPLVNSDEQSYLAVAPTPLALSALEQGLPTEEFQLFSPLLSDGKPLLLKTESTISTLGVTPFTFSVRYSENPLARHIIGYTDSEGNGVSGIERGYDELLKEYGGSATAKYTVNAFGQVLGEDASEITDTRTTDGGGVVLTLDRRVQEIAENAATMEKGAIVIMDVDTGEILAMLSTPTYSVDTVADALNDENQPLFNRATAAYTVGSSFKLIVTAAALEQGYTVEHSYECPGYYQLNDVIYTCHKRDGHWLSDMWRGLGQSCNPYFIDLGLTLGAESVLNMATDFGFGSATKLADGIISDKGNLADVATITQGELANLSFGQGVLLATPVQITQMSAIIANGGYYVTPQLYYGETSNGVSFSPTTIPQGDRIITQATADTMHELMTYVVEVGSGREASSQYATTAGKTATAQTGIYTQGEETIHGWFTGFFPVENPKYAITVFDEGGGNGGALPAQIFGEICSDLALLDNPDIAQSLNTSQSEALIKVAQ